MLQVVENQIKADKPPETKVTVERLLASGIQRTEAIRLSQGDQITLTICDTTA
jgi:hypothetical protein